MGDPPFPPDPGVRGKAAAICALLVLALGASLPAAQVDATGDLLGRGLAALDGGNPTQAVAIFEEATRVDPLSAPAWLGLAESRRRAGRLVEALEAVRRSRSLDPTMVEISIAMAQIQMELRALPDALTTVRDARRIEPQNLDAILLEAEILRLAGRLDEARELLSTTWASGARGSGLAQQLALLHVTMQDREAAEAVATEGLEAEPGDPILHFAMGAALAADPDRLDESVAWLERALASGIDNPARVHLELGEVELRRGDAASSLDHLLQARQELDDAAPLWTAIAAAQRALGDAASAQVAERRAADLRGDRERRGEEASALRSGLEEARDLATAGRLPEALRRLDDLAEAGDRIAGFHALRAQVLFSLRRPAEALAAIERAVEIEPGRAQFAYFHGLYLLVAGRAAEAEAALRTAISLDDTLAEAQGLLAGALAKQGRAAEAVEHFETALELGLDNSEVRLGYADALRRVGRTEESEEQMKIWRRLSTSGG